MWNSERWAGFELREDDIIISTPPKCGTTWMQMQCALLVFRTPDLPGPLSTLSPWLDMNTRPLADVLADLAAQTHRRFIKTHTPLGELPWDERVTYLHVGRDPRDVAMSWDNHVANTDVEHLFDLRAAAVGLDDLGELGIDGPPPPRSDDREVRFWEWMEVEGADLGTSGLTTLVAHSGGFWDARERPNVHLFHYTDMQVDLPGQMTRLALALGVDPPDDDLVEAARFAAMKARAHELVPNADVQLFESSSQFFDRARSGDWRALIGDEGLPRYETALGSTSADDGHVAWLHGGWLGTT